MSIDNDVEITGHDYDGIKEYDNPLPRWWLLTFYATIIFSFIYVIHYESGAGPTMQKELEMAMSEIQKAKAAGPVIVSENEDSLLEKSKDPQLLAVGAEKFTAMCASCHGNELQGLIGPNLTDDYWLHGQGKISENIGTIQLGVADKGMPPWQDILKHEEITAVALYIHSKLGSQPANAKEPQGQLVKK